MPTVHMRAFSSPAHLHAGRARARFTCVRCCSTSQRASSKIHGQNDLPAKRRLRDALANTLITLGFSAAVLLQQPTQALADTSTMPPPYTSSSSSAASQAASRTVVDVVGGENSVLSEENTPDNRQGSEQTQREEQKTNPIGETSEVRGAACSQTRL